MARPKIVPVFVVLPPRTMLLDVAGPLEVLSRANAEQAEIAFTVRYVGVTRTVETSIGILLADVEPLPDQLPANSVVVIVGQVDRVMRRAGSTASAVVRDQERAIVEWLRSVGNTSHKLVAICSGALFAGRAGLLDGLSCTTHHLDCVELASLAPKAKVLNNRLFVQDGQVYTCAGVTSGIDLMLYVLNQFVGQKCTLAVARYLVVYLRRSGADPQISPWLDGRNHIHPVIHRVQDAIASDPARAWTREQLASIAGASGRHLSRLFHDHVGMRIIDYRNRLRVALARELLSQTQLDMERVAERSGFESTRQLRRAWGRLYSSSPKHSRDLPEVLHH